jgi:16S rRNA (cytosine1402-N4)-methyltransferase
MTIVHQSVLRSEVLENLVVDNPEVYVDLTSGAGGHAEAFIDKYEGIQAILLDRDNDAVAHLKEKFNGVNTVKVVKSDAGSLDKVMFLLKIRKADIILADLGVSSHQFDTASRGFSIKHEGPMDMRMDQDIKMTALDYIKSVTETELKNILSEYAQERESGRVAKALKNAAENGAITTTEFAQAVKKAKRFFPRGIDPATQVFMALRMAVNNETGQLEKMLRKAFKVLSTGGKLGIITFHSTEDRIVKKFFRERKEGLPYYDDNKTIQSGFTKVYKPLLPKNEEIENNPRSRSAKLRIIEKLEDKR